MKRQISIEEYKNNSNVHTIIINNARYQEDFNIIVQQIIKEFFVDEEVFFGFYRTDGMNLTLEQQRQLKSEIPSFFKKYGDIIKLSDYLEVAKINLKSNGYSFITSVFDYFLETMIFNPKVDWDTFKLYHSNYQNHRFDEIILNNFAEILVCYIDSGDFLICFNPQKYSIKKVRNRIVELFFCESGDGSVIDS